MIDLLKAYWLEACIAAGVAVIMLPTVAGPVMKKLGVILKKQPSDTCLDDLAAVVTLQQRHPEIADQLDSVAVAVLQAHRGHK